MMYAKRHATPDFPDPQFEFISQTEWKKFEGAEESFVTSVIAPYDFEELKLCVYDVDSQDVMEQDMVGFSIIPNYVMDRWKLHDERMFKLVGDTLLRTHDLETADSRINLKLVYSSKFDPTAALKGAGALPDDPASPPPPEDLSEPEPGESKERERRNLLESEVHRLDRMTTLADSQTETIRKKLRQQNEGNRHLASTNMMLIIELRAVKDALDKANAANAGRGSELDAAKAEIAALNDLIAKLRKEIGELKDDKTALNQTIGELEARIAELLRQIAKLRLMEDEYYRLQRLLPLEEMVAGLQAALEASKAKIAGMETAYNALQTFMTDKIKAVNLDLNVMTADRDDLAEQLRRLRKQLAELEAKLASMAGFDDLNARWGAAGATHWGGHCWRVALSAHRIIFAFFSLHYIFHYITLHFHCFTLH
jgi:hypothetical protein